MDLSWVKSLMIVLGILAIVALVIVFLVVAAYHRSVEHPRERHPRLSLDCLDDNHRACDGCECFCHYDVREGRL